MRPARLSDVQMLQRLRRTPSGSADTLAATTRSGDSSICDSDGAASLCEHSFPPLRRRASSGGSSSNRRLSVSEQPRARPLPAVEPAVSAGRRHLPAPSAPERAPRGIVLPSPSQMSTASVAKQLVALRKALSLLCPSTDAHRQLQQRPRDFEQELVRRGITITMAR